MELKDLVVGQFIHWKGESSNSMGPYSWDCYGVVVKTTEKEVTIATFDLERKRELSTIDVLNEEKSVLIADPDIAKIKKINEANIRIALKSEIEAYFDKTKYELERATEILSTIKENYFDKYKDQNR